ncbi:hypothetical protein FHS44_002795 [Streptosporangium saharense]|uniref:Uncharacterized protein n=1 Tax=Streptosporangium saharense TaxID=1706840 RepID=A0A7W7QLC0_9ACTN|nr:hypothetical protein [Streptosporangium saharense]
MSHLKVVIVGYDMTAIAKARAVRHIPAHEEAP